MTESAPGTAGDPSGGSWLETRSGFPSLVRSILNKPLPRNVGWAHTLGSLLLLYLVLQVITGCLLAVYYSASPEHAYDSVRYIQEELVLGRLVYSLHKQGAGFIFVVALLHMGRIYFTSAYKKPRELLWCIGLVLLLVIVLELLTGMLLPYDQRAYWATVVGINMASDAPGVGGWIRDLLTDGRGEIGIVTLVRFYFLHVCVLPIMLILLVVAHLGSLQKTGSAGPPGGSPPDPQQTFFPLQAFRDLVVSALGTLLLFVIAALSTDELGEPASRTVEGFTPYPDWYFLAHFQLLRVLPSGWQQVATVYVPGGLCAALFLLPFLDRGAERHPRRRPVLTGAGVLVVLIGVVLWLGGYRDMVAHQDDPGIPSVADADPLARGKALYEQYECYTCHMIDGDGIEYGPDLTRVARRVRADYFGPFLRNPQSLVSESEMPPFEGTEQELAEIIAYLRSLK